VRKMQLRRKSVPFDEATAGLAKRPRATDGTKPKAGEVIRLYSFRPTGELDAAFEDLFGLACLMGWTAETEVRGLADGASHIRPRMEQVFAGGIFKFILDRPHCKGHLSDAGTALQLLTGQDAQEWAADALRCIEGGGVSDVVEELQVSWFLTNPQAPELRVDTLRVEANYLDRNKDAVAYAEYRENGWGTASSEIESVHRHGVQIRFKIAGAWWHPAGVDDVLALRTLRMNGWWDEFWSQQRNRWRERGKSFGRTRQPEA
jgi:hypothetical protein